MTALLTSRRSFITGLVSFVAAPAIVRAGSLMPVRTMIQAPNMTATEVNDAVRRMMVDMAERAVNPPLLDMADGLWEINYDYAANQIIRILHTPKQYLRVR